MANGNKSFDQANHTTGDMRAAKAKYDQAVKALAGVAADDPKYPDFRKAKFEASVAMSKAREAAEQAYYDEVIEEVKADTEKLKAAKQEAAKVAN